LSKSAQTVYNKDIGRLRSIIKPKGKSSYPIAIGEMHSLIRSSHYIRRQRLSGKHSVDFIVKVLEYQEIFHEEAVRKIVSFSFIINRFSLDSFSFLWL
jgi:hypothetical protein